MRVLMWGIVAMMGTAAIAGTESFVQSMTKQQMISAGKDAFLKRCSGCHGVDAKGTGEAAAMLDPKPRNLVEGSFKFRSTTSGTFPTTQDLLRTLDQGVLGTSMPTFKLVSESEKLAIITYIKSLRTDWNEREVLKNTLSIPAPPEESFGSKAGLLKAAGRGEKIFKETCVTCHGDDGRGHGPNSEGLQDEAGNPITPANLRLKHIKSGKRATDIFKAISTGLDGSPMAGFADAYTEAQRWDLVAYVFYLRGLEAGIYTQNDALGGANDKAGSRSW